MKSKIETVGSAPKIAVCGCGYWGKNLVRDMARLGALAALVDLNPKTAQDLAKEFSAQARSFDEIIADKTITGVMIASPAVTHAELAKKALMAGKHVYIEKPLALNIDDARMLEALAESKGLVLMVGHLLHYHTGYLTLAKEIKAGRIGQVRYIESRRLSLGKLRSEENVVWSFAPHDISMVLGLTGALPQTVTAHESSHVTEGLADTASIHLTFAGSLRAHIMVSWLHPVKEQRLTVIGERGALVFDDTQPWEKKLLCYPGTVRLEKGLSVVEKKDAQPIMLEACEPLVEECRHFLQSVQTGARPRTDAAEGIRVLTVLNAVDAALLRRREIPVHSGPSEASMSDKPYFVHETAVVDDGVAIGAGSKVWHFSHILSGSKLGEGVIVGQNVMIGPEVIVGDRCKIQNNVSLYKGVTLEEGVFCGPSCVFTNVNTPRAEIERKDAFLPTSVGRGATIGANATIICGHRLGAYCLIGAGAVITSDVKPHALMVGNPARQMGWVSHAGERLGEDLTCPREGRRYRENAKGELEEIVGTHEQKQYGKIHRA